MREFESSIFYVTETGDSVSGRKVSLCEDSAKIINSGNVDICMTKLFQDC